ncbi:MAG TPA: GntG family PLP-dependent aldolase, partial [Acidimicrobiales bacterium]
MIVDLRSDTVTKPTAAMRRAMAEAEVGDDGSRDDPTVRRLEEAFAERVGKEAAVFVPSGTMANQIALRIIGTPGTAVLTGRTHHIVAYEMGALAANASVQLLTVDDSTGELDLAQAAWYVAADAHHWLTVSAVFIENTHMYSGGTPWSLEGLAGVAALGRPVHIDGARLFNAEVATGIPAAQLASTGTTVTCCLSKGLGAPVGSLIAGPTRLMEQARVERKRFGGGMRQAGVLAAPGLVALSDHVERLADDHARARRLAEAVAERWPGAVDPTTVRTNMVNWTHPRPMEVVAHLEDRGVLIGTLG